MKRTLSMILVLVMLIGLLPQVALSPGAEENESTENALAGKTLSILGASISTYGGTSNGAAAETTNSTIGSNAQYYPHATVNDVTLNDTWWMQVCNDFGLRLLVNNAWSGSSLLYERNGTVGAYVDRCVQLHDDTGENAGEEPDIIGIQMGTNDFQYYKDTLGTADIDYAALIAKNEDGSYTYAAPTTSLEAAAIVLHKISVRYPKAEVYYLNISQRVDGTDELIRSFNAELKQVVEHFGAHIVDIYGSAITMDVFDTYIGDGRVHPNCLGMDAYTEAFKRALLENTAYAVDTYTVSLDMDGVTADYGDNKIVVSGDSLHVNLTGPDYMDVTVTMGGEDITSAAYADGVVAIDTVTADVTIAATAAFTPHNYRWEFDGTDLTCAEGGNTLTKKAGTTTDGVFSKTCYALKNAVVLQHDLPWAVEWKCEGTFLNTNGSSGARVFTSDNVNAHYNARYIFKSNTNGIVAMGEKTTSGSHNYGIALAEHNIDWTQLHTYRLENRIAEDGTNMVYLFVDGAEIGPMNHYYIGTKDQNTTSDWLSGKDFVFPYMGTDTHGFTNASIDYIQVRECTHSYQNGICTGCGDSFAGKTVSILSHSASTYTGVSNSSAYNSTIGNNDVYYTEGKHGVYRKDTWWQQTIDALGMELLVNNSWSGSCVYMPRKGAASVGYGDRAVNLHNDRTGEVPDVIFVYLGCNDFAYYKDTFGTAADVEYAALIQGCGDGTFTYAVPQTTCEAYAIMLHKVQTRYPDAQIYCMTSTARRETDYTGDSYPDAGQPTEYSAELQKVAKYFDFPVIDLEKAIPKEIELFDLYMGDKRAHPNALGMDQITNAVLSVMLGAESEICHVTSQDGIVAEQAVLKGGSYSAEVVVPEGFAAVVTMNGKDITAEVCENGKITITEVTGDIDVTAVISRQPMQFAWTMTDGELISDGISANTPSKLAGTVTDGVLNDGRYQLEKAVMLKHDLPWVVEWKCSENWRGVFFSSDPDAQTAAMTYISRVNGGQLCIGTWTGKQYDNYGVDISYLDDQIHAYRLENRIAADGSNMVWLYVDDAEIGPMNNYFIGSKNQNKTSSWISGKDFVFGYIGIDGHALRNCRLEYLQVTECAHIYENGICTGCGEEEVVKALPMRYDDHLDMSGKMVEIIDAGKPNSYQVGDGVAENTLDAAVVTLEGDTLVATGIGTAKVMIDGQLYEITVDKAKINLIVIMGQSNAGNHFENATSDVTCPIGTAYWWGNGKGTAATTPVAYTQPSMGFHTPLLAELYAQSAAAGDPVKNVLIWQEGITSKNGQSIVKWAASAQDTSGTDATVEMIQNCRSYYETHSDKYEIVSSGVYWLQGESDTSMDAELYTQRFIAMWQRLEDAGMEYLAFLRLRRGTTENDAYHDDLSHSASLSAQIRMINDNPAFYMATDLTENWVGTETASHTIDISKYITVMEAYGGSSDYTDAYGNHATYADGLLTTTMQCLYGSNNKCHYGKFGYGLIGADAAYNVYRALHTTDVQIMVTDTSGHADRQELLSNGGEMILDITAMTEHLSFRAACGSAAGTLKLAIYSGDTDITSQSGLLVSAGQLYGSVDTTKLQNYENVSIKITYTTADGKEHTAVCKIYAQPEVSKKDYIWDFDEDLYARGTDGEILNALIADPVAGKYTLENGYLSGQALVLQLNQLVELEADKNWSVEWKYGAFTNGAAGFLLCEDATNTVGNKAFYHVSSGRMMISDYADQKGYYNYTSSAVTVAEYDCLRITNSYDPITGQSTLSLWQNGKLVIENFQEKGNINTDQDNLDMTKYPLSGEFAFRYLGHSTRAEWGLNCELDYLKISFGEESDCHTESLDLRYDDHYDIAGKAVEIIDAGNPNSYQVGYSVEENAVLDTAVVAMEGNYLVATGIGTAKVSIDGQLYEVTVEAAPISFLLLIGQSNMEGNEGDLNQSIVCPDGMVYATYGDRYDMVLSNATHYAPSALTGAYRTVNTVGGTDGLADYPVYMLTDEGDGRKGPDSGFAYEWVRQTGEKVWIVNASHGGTSLNVWQPGTTQYEECQAMFGACAETLRREIAAGHFTLSHMAYFWCQGCNDYDKTAQWYVENYLIMHEALKTELAFDHDSNPETQNKTFEFGGIIPVRAGHEWRTYYREGVYTDTTDKSYYESFLDLQMSGPRVAQYWMGNNPELTDIWNVCTIGESWVWMPDGTNGVSEYFQAHYPGGRVDYETQVPQKEAWYTPTTPAAVHDSIHYNQIGYNEVGREAVRNALIYMGINEDYAEPTTVKFVDWTGYREVSQIGACTEVGSATLVVPIVSPITRCKDVTYTLTEGLDYSWYDLTVQAADTVGTLEAVGAAGSVFVEKQKPGALYAEHLSQLPESICAGVNLWTALSHDSQYYTVSGWGVHSSGKVFSVTIPVQAGDRIWATSMGANGVNGNTISTGHGIRVTFFGDYGVIVSMSSTDVYAQFSTNGYLTAPEGTTAVNVPMWSDSDQNELYILNLPHSGDGICSICGKDTHEHSWSDWQTVLLPSQDAPGQEQRTCSGCGSTESREVAGVWQTLDLGTYLLELPENTCCSLDLWKVLEHNEYYFHSGVKWAKHESGKIRSVTIPVSEGDCIFATSFGKYGENGNTVSKADGIRVTWFDAYGVVKTTDPAGTYAEFAENGGYLIAPEGAVAINIAMWNESMDNEIYILSRGHCYENGRCAACAMAAQEDAALRQLLDLNGDGEVTAFDAQILAEAKADKRKLTAEQWIAIGILTPQDILNYILGTYQSPSN